MNTRVWIIDWQHSQVIPVFSTGVVQTPQAPEAVEETAVGNPVVEAPAIEELVDEADIFFDALAIQGAISEETAVNEPIIEAPAVEDPVVKEVTVDEPVIEVPAVEDPIVQDHISEAAPEEPNRAQEDAVVIVHDRHDNDFDSGEGNLQVC
jgi:hypothetical protein